MSRGARFLLKVELTPRQAEALQYGLERSCAAFEASRPTLSSEQLKRKAGLRIAHKILKALGDAPPVERGGAHGKA